MLRSIRPKRASRPSDASVDPTEARRRNDQAHLHRPREVALHSQKPTSRPESGAAPGSVVRGYFLSLGLE
jgi:hypothetical protein